MLLDSNIIIYASKLTYPNLLNFLRDNEDALKVSALTKIEVLGYHQLKKLEKQFLENFFDSLEILPITEDVVEKTIALKQKRPLSTGDAIIAATALLHNLTLFTENVKDFSKIENIKIISIQDIS